MIPEVVREIKYTRVIIVFFVLDVRRSVIMNADSGRKYQPMVAHWQAWVGISHRFQR